MAITQFLHQQNISPDEIKTVSGGDINLAFAVKANNGKSYFLKENSAPAFPGMFRAEAAGLKTMSENSNLVVPEVIAIGENDGQQYLLLEMLEKASPARNFWEVFGM